VSWVVDLHEGVGLLVALMIVMMMEMLMSVMMVVRMMIMMVRMMMIMIMIMVMTVETVNCFISNPSSMTSYQLINRSTYLFALGAEVEVTADGALVSEASLSWVESYIIIIIMIIIIITIIISRIVYHTSGHTTIIYNSLPGTNDGFDVTHIAHNMVMPQEGLLTASHG
jgi:hypothetical protein